MPGDLIVSRSPRHSLIPDSALSPRNSLVPGLDGYSRSPRGSLIPGAAAVAVAAAGSRTSLMPENGEGVWLRDGVRSFLDFQMDQG